MILFQVSPLSKIIINKRNLSIILPQATTMVPLFSTLQHGQRHQGIQLQALGLCVCRKGHRMQSNWKILTLPRTDGDISSEIWASIFPIMLLLLSTETLKSV